jgi:hypothetical protein
MILRHKRSVRSIPAPLSLLLFVGVVAMPLAGCGGTGGESGDEMEAASQQAEPVTLGPRDGHDLPPTDLERVAVGTVAPDFSLETITGEILTLSAFQGAKNVILVFYRGHW